MDNRAHNPIGFSTGCLNKSGLTMYNRIQLYYQCGADAVELSFATKTELMNFNISDKIREVVMHHDFVTLHAPWKEIRYKGSESADAVERIKSICEELNVAGVVFHPDIIDDFSLLEGSGLPVLIENMDKRKKYGTSPENFREIAERYDFGFVVDLQHAYEHDPSMMLAKELLDAASSRLSHIHVSGQDHKHNHWPVHLADNREEIEGILEMRLDAPKIAEGLFLKKVSKAVFDELSHIKGYELCRRPSS